MGSELRAPGAPVARTGGQAEVAGGLPSDEMGASCPKSRLKAAAPARPTGAHLLGAARPRFSSEPVPPILAQSSGKTSLA
jgi:hypothetical protein